MTNAEIIMSNRIFLMEQGLLKATDQKMMHVDENGVRKECFVPEEIHTFNAWKKMGFIVQKGEHAIAKFPIWKYSEKTRKDDDGEEKKDAKMYMKVAFFFTAEQVKPIK